MNIQSRVVPIALLLGLGGLAAFVGCKGRGALGGTPYYGPGTGPIGSFVFSGTAQSGIGVINPGPAMQTARGQHTATAFAANGTYTQGGVLVVGGHDSKNNPLPESEIYDAAANTWTLVSKLNANATQAYLNNLHAIGNPQPPPVTARFSHVAVGISGGSKILICGGEGGEDPNQTSQFLKTAFVFDASQTAFTQVDDMPDPRSQFAAVLLTTGKVLICTGLIDNPNPAARNQIPAVTAKTAALFDSTQASGAQWAPVGGSFASNVTDAHWGGVIVGQGNQATICGGANVEIKVNPQTGAPQLSIARPPFPTAQNRCETYDSGSNSFKTGPALSDDRVFSAGVALAQGDAILAGGDGIVQGQLVLLNTIDHYDHTQAPGAWKPSGPMPMPPATVSAQSPHEERDNAVAAEVDNGRSGSVLISGGNGAQGILADAVLWQLRIDGVQVQPAAAPAGVLPMSEPRLNHACAQLFDGRLVICGGVVDTKGTVTGSVDIYGH